VADSSEVRSRAVVIATGMAYRRLGIPALDALTGAGVFYGAAASEARAMKDSEVFVVGGANSAGQAAVHLARYAAHVTVLVRGRSLADSMSEYLCSWNPACPGVFAVGDVRHGSVKRVAAAVGEGSIAISLVHDHLRSNGRGTDSEARHR
jgi:thioredoxin reductase